ncbi:MAG TPA: CBS domain-containing protein [Steroidobacteraceae bacterium]
MYGSHLLVPRSASERAPTRYRTHLQRLRASDPAVRAMTDFLRDPPLTATEDCDLDRALDDMFRLGVRAFLVVRDLAVLGLITVEDIRHARRGTARRVVEVMTGAADMPAIDWQMLQQSTVSDLIEIFEGACVHHLVVVESESAQRASVRGLVQRSRVERRLRQGGA